MSSTSQAGSPVPLPILKNKLETAVAERGPIYKAIAVLIFTFENDNTGAANDAVDLESCFRDIFGLTDITRVLLKSSDKSPGWTLMGVIRGIITRIEEARSL